MRTIVISAINFIEGGPRSVLQDCLSACVRHLGSDYKIVALVHKAALYPDLPGVQFYEYPRSKSSWLIRLMYELLYFRILSKRLKPYLWVSLHDITPNVIAKRRAVYCHNPSPFFRPSARQALLDPVFWFFNKFYKFVYKINIKKNDFVIVQQEWMRDEFRKLFGLNDNVVVAHPTVQLPVTQARDPLPRTGPFKLIFPTYPRVFKNCEVVGEAAALLERQGVSGIEVLFTFSGHETRYAQDIFRRYGNLNSVKFIGVQSREKIFQLYDEVDGLIFPSSLETWGLPLTEFKHFNKPILVADLAYAHESVGCYEQVKFFDPKDPAALANILKLTAAGAIKFDRSNASRPAEPFADGWEELFDILLGPDSVGRQ